MALLLVAALLASVVTVSPSAGGRHDRFVVEITSRHATGVFGSTRRGYVAEARPSPGVGLREQPRSPLR
jgi:hypothetical protein